MPNIEERLNYLEQIVARHMGSQQGMSTSNLPHPNMSAISQGVYTITNQTNDRTYDANASSVDELADVLSQVIADLKLLGILG